MNAQTHSQPVEEETTHHPMTAANERHEKDSWMYPSGSQREVLSLDEDWENHFHLLLSIQLQLEQKFAKGYGEDPYFKSRIVDVVLN
jgi:hypothetical protein